MSDWIPNSFQVPNAFVDEAMKKLSPSAAVLYITIVRKTRGWQKNVDAISLTQFEKITGLSRKTVVKGIAELVEFGFVNEHAQKTAKSAKSYELNTSVFSTLVDSPLVEKFHPTSGEIPPTTSGEIPHTKTTIKTTYKKQRNVGDKSDSKPCLTPSKNGLSLSEKQASVFASKLSEHPEFCSMHAAVGESGQKFVSRVKLLLRTPGFVEKNMSYLEEVGFKRGGA